MSRVKLLLSFALPLSVLGGCHESGQTPPPWGVPVTGGTLLVTRDGSHAVVADPDRDRIVSVDLTTGTVKAEIELTPGDEPGRLVEDGIGRIHVALRRGGHVMTLADAASGIVADRRFACTEPRGIVWEQTSDQIHVACAGGELVSFAAAGGAAVRTLRLDRDLRDVVVSNGNLVLTRFKTAELITIDSAGNIVSRATPPTVQRFTFGGGGLPPNGSGSGGTDGGAPSSEPGMGGLVDAIPTIAWRSIALPNGSIITTHQRQVKIPLGTKVEGGYGGDCGEGPVESAVTVTDPGQPPRAIGQIAAGALPVDIAASPDGSKLALVVAGNRTVTIVSTSFAMSRVDEDRCEPPPPPPDDDPRDDDEDTDGDDEEEEDDLGMPTSSAFRPSGELVIFYPERPALAIRAANGTPERIIVLPGKKGRDAGRRVFHTQTSIGLACASCHPEGREDGLVWEFAEFGPRRTQNLAGHLLERAPFHWGGDMATLDVLMDDVFAKRMSGGQLTDMQKRALGPWLDRLPAPPPAQVDVAAVARGADVFEAANCASCHNGDLLTNNQMADVGTGGKFKVPSLLGVNARAPFMHNGCAPTLRDRFISGFCGGGDKHGNTSHLSPEQLSDLVAYLESL